MAWYRQFWNVLRPGRVQRDLERELSFHVAERVEELQAGGMSEEEAVCTARRQFGNFTAQVERTREVDIHGWLESATRNVRYAPRALRKTPGFTVTVMLTLALGIGANSAVFSAINAVLLRPMPFPHGDQLMTLAQVRPKVPGPFVAPVRLEDWNKLNSTFQAISGYYSQDDSELSGELPEKLRRAFVAPRFLQVWGIAPELGRGFTPQEEHFGGPAAVLISDRLWRRRFGGNPNAIGKALRLGGSLWPIIGVLPASFAFPERDVDLWSSSPPDAPYAQNRENTWFNTIGRLKPRVTIEQARANLAIVQAALARQYPKPDAEITVHIAPLKDATVGGVKKSLWLLFGSVSLLLLIACTNIAALLLSRAAGRQHEISVRFSLGASRAAVAWQLFTEVLLLALAGAALGLIVAGGAAGVFRTLARQLPRLDEIRLDARIVLYSLACAVAATLLCGVLPAIRGTRNNLARSLAQSGRAHVSRRNPVQLSLVGVQVALAVTLLAGAGLLLRSFQELGRVSPGFDPARVLTFHISSSWGETVDYKAVNQRVRRVLDALQSLPGIEAVSTVYSLPGVPAEYQVEVKTVEGRPETEPKMLAQARAVSPGYFATMRIPLLAGELCRDDAAATTMMVNSSFANAYFPGGAAAGHRLVQPSNPNLVPSEITGIVGDARETGLDQAPVPTAYWCTGTNQPGTHFLARTHGEPMAMAETVRRKIHEIEPQRSVYDLTPLSEHISDAYSENRLRTVLLTFFAATAVLLACVGLYGTLSYLVNVRQREVGLRLALGAMRTQIVRQYLAQGLRVSVLGCAAGLALATLSARLLAGMLYGVSPSDPETLLDVVALVLAVSALASLLPAMRAARLEPMQVLREE
ncbi:MAG TPA: ABC transporter permease [Bryobacteraceae bacterium]|nr:ABC transporter permease [Bryobacteraceae bacterium]